jgi:hypothetical protein
MKYARIVGRRGREGYRKGARGVLAVEVTELCSASVVLHHIYGRADRGNPGYICHGEAVKLVIYFHNYLAFAFLISFLYRLDFVSNKSGNYAICN